MVITDVIQDVFQILRLRCLAVLLIATPCQVPCLHGARTNTEPCTRRILPWPAPLEGSNSPGTTKTPSRAQISKNWQYMGDPLVFVLVVLMCHQALGETHCRPGLAEVQMAMVGVPAGVKSASPAMGVS